MSLGIYTLANDMVFDQLVALLNSIEVFMGKDIPVCVIPFDKNIRRIKGELKQRPQAFLWDNLDLIAKWDLFAKNAWQKCPISRNYSMGIHRRYCAFDGPFEKFIYIDADVIVLDNLSRFFEKLDDFDFVVYDFTHTEPGTVFNLKSEKLEGVFSKERIGSEIFCSGFFASKKTLFSEKDLNWFLASLDEGEADILNRALPDQSLLSYMAMRKGLKVYNFALNLPDNKISGNCAGLSLHFEQKENLLFDKGVRLTYLHFIGVSRLIINRVCLGENINFPYRDIFLYYRYLKAPGLRPLLKGEPKTSIEPENLFKRLVRKAKNVCLKN